MNLSDMYGRVFLDGTTMRDIEAMSQPSRKAKV